MNFDQLVTLCQRTHEELYHRAARLVDAHLVARNWLFGHYIAEFEQKGADRAQYGARLLGSLADRLQPLEIRGSSVTRLKLYRSFYRTFPIGPTLSDQSLALSRDKEEIRRLATEGLVVEKAADLIPAPTVRPKPAQGNALGYNPKIIQALKGRSNPCRNRSPVSTSRENGSRPRAHRSPLSPGRPDMARLPYPNPMFQLCAITSADNGSITGRSHSRTNTEPFWCDTELISMNDTSGISSPWAAPSGLHSLLSARPRALPWAGMVCPVGAQEVHRLEQITHELEGGGTP